MRVRLLYAGGGMTIPKTPLEMGLGAVSVWIDGVGFTSASNDTGATGYILLDTNSVDIGEINSASADKFSSLHGKNVRFALAPSTFLYDGGTARIKITVLANEGGSVVEYPIEFVANNCVGVAVKSDNFAFTTEMFQMERSVADTATLIESDELTASVEIAQEAEEVVG